MAAERGHLNIIQYYKEHLNYANINPGQVSNDQFNGRTPLHYAAQFGQFEVVKYIIQFLNEKNPQDSNGHTPLHLAAGKGHLDIVKFIVSFVNDKNPKSGRYWDERTPLHNAAWNGHLDVVKYLVPGIVPDVNVKDTNNKTPLDYAKENGHEDVVNYLERFQ